MTSAGHPVSLSLAPPAGERNRLTVLLRPLLVLPHALLVGVSVLLLGGTSGHRERSWRADVNVTPMTIGAQWKDRTEASTSNSGNETKSSTSTSHEGGVDWRFGGPAAGALGMAASAVALLDWFAVLFLGNVLVGAQGIKLLYLRWRARVLVYASLLRDEYPPFGEGDHPASLTLVEAPLPRRRGSVFLRPLTVIPHFLVLALLSLPFLVVLVASWVLLLIDRRLPPSFWRFLAGVVQWTLRVEAYLLLIHDEFPPFSLELSPPAGASPPT